MFGKTIILLSIFLRVRNLLFIITSTLLIYYMIKSYKNLLSFQFLSRWLVHGTNMHMFWIVSKKKKKTVKKILLY